MDQWQWNGGGNQQWDLISTSGVPFGSASAALSRAVGVSGSVHGLTRTQGSQTVLDGSGTVGSLGAVTSHGLRTASGAKPMNDNGTPIGQRSRPAQGLSFDGAALDAVFADYDPMEYHLMSSFRRRGRVLGGPTPTGE